MENMIFIGAKIDKETAINLGAFVEAVFKSGKETGMDQSTIVSALSLVQKVITPEGTTISNCIFTNGDNAIKKSETADSGLEID